MIETAPAYPYERTDVEFEAVEPNDPRESPRCKHCGRIKGIHWQTADGKIWCLKGASTAGDKP